MLKKLRIRFICINMAIVLVLLSAIMALVMGSTRASLDREYDTMLDTAASNPWQNNFPQKGGPSRLPSFTIQVDVFGEIKIMGASYFDLTDESVVADIMESTIARGTSSGELSQYGLRYRIVHQSFSDYYIYADVSGITMAMKNLLNVCMMVGACGLIIFFVVSIFLARWAVRPVDKAWKQQKQFVSDASHELKTPLTVIMTNAELLQSEELPSENRDQLAKNIYTMSTQMRGLVEGLLDLARVDNGAIQKSFSEIDMSALVEQAEMPFEPLFYEKGLELTCSIEPNIYCRGSHDHLRQVIEILLDNAQKYSDPGTVTLTLQKHNHSHLLLSVSNPGEPLSEEECREIFKRFYRADKVRAMTNSYGLGLSIAEAIVNDHNGKIWCEGKDNSNTFYVSLPLLNSIKKDAT